MTDAELRKTMRKAITESLHLAGVPLAVGDPVHLDLSNGDVVMQLADGRTFRFGDSNNFAGGA